MADFFTLLKEIHNKLFTKTTVEKLSGCKCFYKSLKTTGKKCSAFGGFFLWGKIISYIVHNIKRQQLGLVGHLKVKLK